MSESGVGCEVLVVVGGLELTGEKNGGVELLLSGDWMLEL